MLLCRSDIDLEATYIGRNLSEVLNEKWQFQVPSITVEAPKKIQFSSAFIREQMQHKVSRSSTIFYTGIAVLGGALLALGFVVYMKLQTQNNREVGNGFNLVPLMVLFLPGSVICTDYDDDMPVKPSMWSILEKLEISNVVVNGIVIVFLVYVLVVMFNALKTLRLANRILRAVNNGEFIN